MRGQRFTKEQCGLLIVDMQDRLIRAVEAAEGLLANAEKLVRAFSIFQLPLTITEQYPKGLGETCDQLRDILPGHVDLFPKLTFSCMADEQIRGHLLSSPATQWVVVGFETHICVLQSVRDLLKAGKQVMLLNDVTASRSIFDYSTAVAEMRDMGARISSTETLLFELLQSATSPEFPAISRLIQGGCGCAG